MTKFCIHCHNRQFVEFGKDPNPVTGDRDGYYLCQVSQDNPFSAMRPCAAMRRQGERCGEEAKLFRDAKQ